MGNAEDQLAVIAVATRYGTAVDTKDWEALASCFAPDGVLHFPNRDMRGPAEIVAAIQAATVSRTWQQHLLGSFQVKVSGDAATSRCSLQALQVDASDPSKALVTAGVYTDRLERRDGQWLIVDRRLEVGFTGVIPHS
ncbi:MAG: nuclear transport factor 2 family protein [Dehalococcoidia bacterium]